MSGKARKVVLRGNRFDVARALADAGIPFAYNGERGGNTVGYVSEEFIPTLSAFLDKNPEFEGRFAKGNPTELDAKTRAWIHELVDSAGGDREKVVRWLQSIGLKISRRDLRAIIAAALDKRDNPGRRFEPGESTHAHVEKVLAKITAGLIENESRTRELLDRVEREQRQERAGKRAREKATPEGRRARNRLAKMLRDARRDERRRPVRENPSHTVSQAEVADAIGMYEKFTGERAGKAELVQVPEPSKATIVLGELASISYVTSKQGGGKTEWVHRFKRPRPKLLADPHGKALFIAGGNFKIDDRGIVG